MVLVLDKQVLVLVLVLEKQVLNPSLHGRPKMQRGQALETIEGLEVPIEARKAGGAREPRE